jgi:hypothetical protein
VVGGSVDQVTTSWCPTWFEQAMRGPTAVARADKEDKVVGFCRRVEESDCADAMEKFESCMVY